MAFEEFEDRRMSDRDRNLVRMRSLSNYVMGVLLLAVGFVFMFPVAKDEDFLAKYDSGTLKIFAVVCWIYGVFRIYRGYRKNYFRES